MAGVLRPEQGDFPNNTERSSSSLPFSRKHWTCQQPRDTWRHRRLKAQAENLAVLERFLKGTAASFFSVIFCFKN